MVKINENNITEMIANGAENMKKLEERQFARPEKSLVLIPFFDELSDELDSHLTYLINGMVTMTLVQNHIEGGEYFIQFCLYLNDFGLRMSPKVVFDLTRFFVEQMTIENQKSDFIVPCAKVINEMYSLCRIGQYDHNDLVIDWQPLYELCMRVERKKVRDVSLSQLTATISNLSQFFAVDEQPKIWSRLQEHLTYDTTATKLFIDLTMFLTVEGMSSEEHRRSGCLLWFDTLWDLYVNIEMNNTDAFLLVYKFKDIVKIVPDVIDWRPFYDVIFTRVTRSFAIPTNKSVIGDLADSICVNSYAYFLAYSIGGPTCSMKHFEQTVKCVEFNVHPSNTGEHVSQIMSFIKTFISAFTNRLRNERISEHRRKVSRAHYLRDDEIDAVARLLSGPVFKLLFCDDTSYTSFSTIIHDLSALNVNLIGGKLLDHLYSAIFAHSEPERFSTTMDSTINIIFQIMRSSIDDLNRKPSTPIPNHWIIRLEEERKSWSTYREGSEFEHAATHQFSSIRHHTIYLMEIYVNSIDVNDVGRAEASLKTLSLIFLSIPVMDFSAALNQPYAAKMSQDDRMLCELSKRVPIIVEETFEKILKAIGHLAVCAAKDSTSNIGTMNDVVSKDGNEERLLKTSITQCVEAIFTHSDQTLTQKLFDRLFEFVSTIEFESFAATDLLAGLMSSCLWVSNKAWKKFADFILQKLRLVITPEVAKAKEAPSTVLYYAVLASAVFCVRAKTIVEHEALLCDIAAILWSCQCLTAYAIAVNGLVESLALLTRLALHPDDELTQRLRSPLTQWNPIDEWTRCYRNEDARIRYYTPSRVEMECAQRIANRFVFPAIDQLEKRLERDEMRKMIAMASATIRCLRDCLKPPESPIVNSKIIVECVPDVTSWLGDCEKVQWEFKTPSGGNVMELVLDKLEMLMKRTDINDPQILEIVALTCIALVEQYTTKKAKYNAYAKHCVEVYWNLDVPLFSENNAVFEKMQFLALKNVTMIEKYSTRCPRRVTEYQLRVIKCLVRLAMNDYDAVRIAASTGLVLLANTIFFCREFLLDELVEVITDPVVANEKRLRGALTAIIALNWAETENPYIRSIVWEAMLKMKVIDEPKIRSLFDTFVESIATCGSRGRFMRIEECVYTPTKVSAIAAELLSLSNLEVWKPYLTADGIQNQRKHFVQYKKGCVEIRNNMIETILKNYIGNSALHHTRDKLARTIVYRCQREIANLPTMRLMLSQLTHDEEEMRDEAGAELANYLFRNRRKLADVDFVAPVLLGSGATAAKNVYGIRNDNMCLVYDSATLPNTEEKWNRHVFFGKQIASFRWPRVVKVNRQIGVFLETDVEMNEVEKEIVGWFENEENVEKWIAMRLKVMDDFTRLNENNIKTIRNLLRNYPSSKKTVEVMRNVFAKLLASKKKEHQSLAAELFAGIALGIRHRPFRELDEFWRWAAPTVDEFLDRMNAESKDEWREAIDKILDDDFDQRRNWWFVEQMVEGAKKENIEEWKQAFRLDIARTSCWRNVEIVNRVCDIAWKKMRIAVTDILRTGIATTLKTVSFLKETQRNNTFDGIDKRFHIESTDVWIDRFNKNITLLGTKTLKKVGDTSRKRAHSATSKSSDDTPPSKRKRGASHCAPPQQEEETLSQIESKKSVLFFRTLLEYLQQYYGVCSQCWTPGIISLLPRLFEFSNESDYEISEDKDIDIIQTCSQLIHANMSQLWVPEQLADSIVATICDAYATSAATWRVRLTIVKFIQILVYSNMFVLRKRERKEPIQKMLFEAIGDVSIDVRTEASKCLSLFIHCDYVVIPDETINQLSQLMNDKNAQAHTRHGAALTLSALITAFPFSLPRAIIKPLEILSVANSKLAIVQNTIKSALREFRKQHKDEWKNVERVLGKNMIFEIENAIVPNYYS